MKNTILIFCFSILLMGCISDKTSDSKIIDTSILGNYVSEGYDKRNEGFDWIAVTLSGTETKPYISVTARKDKKKQTCSLVPSGAEIISENQLKVKKGENEFFVNLNHEEKEISIDFIEFDRRFELMSFCSGGGSLAGRYKRIEGNIGE